MTKEPTLGEFQVKLEAHEQRDIDRFQTTIDNMTVGFKSIIEKLEEMRKDLSTQVADHEARIRSLEQNVTRILTWGSAAIVILGVLEFAAQMLIK